MLDFKNIKETELSELKRIIGKGVEKSELERYYLFSMVSKDKAKIFTLCYRFLLNVANMIEDGDLKKELDKEIKLSEESYSLLLAYLHERDRMDFGKERYEAKIFDIVQNNKDVDNLIDVFSVLTERVNIINIARLKGVVLDGASGAEFKRIMSSE